MSDNEEFIKEFLDESAENLDQLDQDLVALESHPHDAPRLASVFRTIHTIKGTSGFFGFSKLGRLTHVGENLLSRLRDGHLELDVEITNALLELVDAVRQVLGRIEDSRTEGDADHGPLIDKLGRLAERPALARPPTAVVRPPTAVVRPPTAVVRPPTDVVRPPTDVAPPALPAAAGPPAFVAEHSQSADRRMLESTGKELLAPEPLATEPLATEPLATEPLATEPLATEPLATEPLATEYSSSESPSRASLLPGVAEDTPQQLGEPVRVAPPSSEPPSGEPSASEPPSGDLDGAARVTPAVADGTVRVDVNLLDTLMNLAGELVLARNQLRQLTLSGDDATLRGVSQRLDLITSQLQEGITRTRMQPIGNVWAKFPRVVRDLAQACGKQVALEMEGQETELDRSLLEAIKDPLTHLVRNAIDHGIESPETRRRHGKPVMGRLRLRAFHEGGLVNLEIHDDGRGINPRRIGDKALAAGLITRQQFDAWSDQQLVSLIFQAGLSTAERVSDVSGRGVGMDVVKTNIERIGGMIDLQSTQGIGTTVKLKIPLTLAIIPAVVVVSGEQRFVIPQAALVELLDVRGQAGRYRIEMFHQSPVLRLRGQLLPIISLSQELGLSRRLTSVGSEPAPVVVLKIGDRRFGLVVDQIVTSEEIVVKPLWKPISDSAVFSGATVLGDGGVALILDVFRIAQRAGLPLRETPAASALELDQSASGQASDLAAASASLVLCELPGKRRVAMPLVQVARLEQLPHSSLEWSAGREVVQYRGGILPLVRLERVLGPTFEPTFELTLGQAAEPIARDWLQVLVHEGSRRTVGVVVDRVLDVVPQSGSVHQVSETRGILGSVVVERQATELVDLTSLFG